MIEQYNGYGLPAAFSEISNLKAFLLWKKGMTKLNGKFDKIPYYANGQKRHGTQGEPTDLANLVTLHEARIALEANPSYAGIGLALRDNLKIVALDLDNCVENGQLKSEFSNLVSGTYAEVSPSGHGVRLLLRGSGLEDFKNHPEGFELFHSKGFVTLTGNRWPSSPDNIAQLADTPIIREAIEHYGHRGRDDTQFHPSEDVNGRWLNELDRSQAIASIDADVLEDVKVALSVLPDEVSDNREEWIKIGLALKSLSEVFPGEAIDLWHSFSERSHKYDASDADYRWSGFSPGSISYRTIFHMADAVSKGWRKLHGSLGHGSNVWEPYEYDLINPVATDWLIKGIIPTGLGVFSGQPGSGKTTCLLPLMLTVAGFEVGEEPLPIKYPRKIVMVTEASKQVALSLTAMCQNLALDTAHVMRMITIIPARRAELGEIPNLGMIIDKLTIEHACQKGTIPLAPWVIFDTQNSSFNLEDENSNSEVGRLLSLIREHLVQTRNVPVAIVCHASKTTDRSSETVMARGASAFVGDAEFTATFMQHGSGNRFLIMNKVRFDPEHKMLAFDSDLTKLELPDIYGGTERTNVRFSTARIAHQHELIDLEMKAKDEGRARQEDDALRTLDHWVKGTQGNKTAIIQLTSGSPSLPGDRTPDLVFRVSSEKLKEFRLSAAAHAERLQEEYGWTRQGSYLVREPRSIPFPA